METYKRMVEGHPRVDANDAVKGKLYYVKTTRLRAGEVSKSFLGQLVDFRRGTIWYSPYLTFAVVNPNDLTSSLGIKNFEGQYIHLFDLPDDILPPDRKRDKAWLRGNILDSEGEGEDDDDSGTDDSGTDDYIPAGSPAGRAGPLYKEPVDTSDSVANIANIAKGIAMASDSPTTGKSGRDEDDNDNENVRRKIEGGKRKSVRRKSVRRKSVRRKSVRRKSVRRKSVRRR